MPRRRNETEIPGTFLRSDAHAQRLWKKAHDSAVETYGEGGRAHRGAYAALKHEYEKRGDKWVRKNGKGRSEERRVGKEWRSQGPSQQTKSKGRVKCIKR